MVNTQRAAGIVHQDGYVRHVSCQFGDRRAGGDVEGDGSDPVALGWQGIEASRLRAAAITSNSSAANRRAVAAPMPLLAPVTTAIFGVVKVVQPSSAALPLSLPGRGFGLRWAAERKFLTRRRNGYGQG